MSGKHETHHETEDVDEFMFTITARSYNEMEEIIVEDLLPTDEDQDPLHRLPIDEDGEEDLFLPALRYDLTHIPQDPYAHDTPFVTLRVYLPRES